jgi:CRP-like cAMP-binding protein
MNRVRAFINQFIPFTDDDWVTFHALFSFATLRRDEHFAIAGRREHHIGFLIQGVIRAYYRNNEGKEYNKTFFTGNEFIGAYASVVTGNPNQIYLQALTDCELFVADYHKIESLFPAHRQVETLCRLLAQSFYIQKEKREIELALLSAPERYRIFLTEYNGLENLIQQYHIASYLGITPTQLSRIRAKTKTI